MISLTERGQTTMITCYKNKASDKLFIEIDPENSLFINPEGKIIELEYNLFLDEPIEFDANDEHVSDYINEQQLKKYRSYREKETQHMVKDLFKSIEIMSPEDIKSAKLQYPDSAWIYERIEQAIREGLSSKHFE